MKPCERKEIRVLVICLLLFALVAISGCVEPSGLRFSTRVFRPVNAFDQRIGDPATLATMKSVAILPFDNNSGKASLDVQMFARRLASQLSSSGKVRVVFPGEILRLVKMQNEEIDRYNMDFRKNQLLGKTSITDRRQRMDEARTVSSEENRQRVRLDPVRKRSDAIKIGRQLKVDVILMGNITDYDPYYRPRVSVSVTAIATGWNNTAANRLAELVQWGIPRDMQHSRGVAWTRQQVFDTRDGGTAREVYLFARNHHTEDRPYDTEIYLRSMSRFFEFIGATIANKLLDAKSYAMNDAMARAKKESIVKREEQAAVMNRIRYLVSPEPNLPSGKDVLAKNMRDRRNYSWTRTDYAGKHTDRTQTTKAEKPKGVIRW